MSGFLWNQSVVSAIKKISRSRHTASKFGHIDNVFNACEFELEKAGAPEREISVRLFVLAQYCERCKNQDFFRSAVFARFSPVLGFPHFRRAMRTLFKQNDCAVIVFWVVFRCAFKNFVSRSYYEAVENKLKSKSYELGTKHSQGLL